MSPVLPVVDMMADVRQRELTIVCIVKGVLCLTTNICLSGVFFESIVTEPRFLNIGSTEIQAVFNSFLEYSDRMGTIHFNLIETLTRRPSAAFG